MQNGTTVRHAPPLAKRRVRRVQAKRPGDNRGLRRIKVISPCWALLSPRESQGLDLLEPRECTFLFQCFASISRKNMTNAPLLSGSSSSDQTFLPFVSQRYRFVHVLRFCMCIVFGLLACLGPTIVYELAVVWSWDPRTLRLTRIRNSTNVVTLAFNRSKQSDLKMIAHNCAMLSRTNHKYHIYTDDTSPSFCSRCSCVRFQPKNCTCPNPSASNCGLCEKLHFLIDTLHFFKEMVFLDSDLIVLREDFVDRLLARSAHFDFLAAYGFGHPCNMRFHTPFNSGLMFIRMIPNVNYSKMVDIMWELNDNNDQNIISKAVRRQYSNWDTLSLRWHCRYLYKEGYDIPPSECYTFHGRSKALSDFLWKTNSTLLDTWD